MAEVDTIARPSLGSTINFICLISGWRRETEGPGGGQRLVGRSRVLTVWDRGWPGLWCGPQEDVLMPPMPAPGLQLSHSSHVEPSLGFLETHEGVFTIGSGAQPLQPWEAVHL